MGAQQAILPPPAISSTENTPSPQSIRLSVEKHVSFQVSEGNVDPTMLNVPVPEDTASSRRSSSLSAKRYSPNRPSPLHRSSASDEEVQAPPVLPPESVASNSTVARPRACSSVSTLSNESSTLASSAVSEVGLTFTAEAPIAINTDVTRERQFVKVSTPSSPSGKKPSLLSKMIAESDSDKTLLHHAVARRRRQMMRYQSSPDMVLDAKMDLETYENIVAPMIEAKAAAQPARRVATYSNLPAALEQSQDLYRGHSSEVDLRLLNKESLDSRPSLDNHRPPSVTPSWASDSVLNPEIRGIFRPRAGSTSSRASRSSSRSQQPSDEERVPMSAGPRLEHLASNAW